MFSPLAKKIRQLLRLSLSLSGNILQTCCVRTLSLQVTPLSIFSPSVFPRFLFFYLATSLIPPMSNNMRQQVWLFHVCLVDRFLKRNEMEKERREATGGGGGRLESKSMEYVCPSDATEEEQSILLPASNWNGIFFICFVFILFFILENCFEWRLPPHVLPNAPQVKKKRMKKKKEREKERRRKRKRNE